MTQFLEFSAVLFGPTFDDYFLVGVKLDRVTALAVEIAEETVLPSAEGEVGHGRGDSDVDADVAGGRFVAEAACGRSARRKQRRLVAVGAAFEERKSFVHAVGVNKAEDGAEDFGVGEIAGGRNVIEDCRVHKVSGFVLRNLRAATVEQDFRALFFAEADERFHAFPALWPDHGAHLDAVFQAVTNFEFRGGLGDGITKRLLRLADHDRGRDRETALSRAAERAVADNLRGHLHVGVGQDDDVIFGSALALAALALLAGARVDVTRYRGRSNKADRTDLRMVDQSIDDGFATVY